MKAEIERSGRLQTVHADANPLDHQLISEFSRLTSIPIVLKYFLQRKRTSGVSPGGSARLLSAYKDGFIGARKFLD